VQYMVTPAPPLVADCAQVGNQYACTLTSSGAAHEGFAGLSIDGRVLTLGCYNAPVGSTSYTSSALRVIARIFSNGASLRLITYAIQYKTK
jgi:hypothetical protein